LVNKRWRNGTKAQRHKGKKDQWQNGTTAQWYNGARVKREEVENLFF